MVENNKIYTTCPVCGLSAIFSYFVKRQSVRIFPICKCTCLSMSEWVFHVDRQAEYRGRTTRVLNAN